MKILFFVNGLHPGGKERRMLELMKKLKLRKDIEFELVLMNNEISYPEIFDMNVKLHYLLRKTKKDFSIFNSFYILCREYKPDIIHCWDSMTAIYSIPSCKLLKIKLVNGMVVNSPSRRNIFNKDWLRAKLVFPFSDVIIGNSKAGLEAYSAPAKKSFVIYNGYDFKRNTQLLDKKIVMEQLQVHTKYVIGMVARFSKKKDYKTFYRAADIVLRKRNDVTFLAIGHNTDSLASQELVNSQFSGYFRLLGKKSGIESIVNRMDICVLATFTEGISNSVMEYMALGKPVIATSGGGTNEILIDNKTGFLVKTSNPEDIAKRIELLLNDAKLRSQMGLLGQARIRDIFSIDEMVKKYTFFYERLIQRKCKYEFEPQKMG